MKPTLFGRGAGEGLGVHICTGPVFVRGAEPGDILEVRILDIKPRPCANPEYAGKTFGSNAAAWWGFHYKDLLTEPKPREVITIYEIDTRGRKELGLRRLQFPLDAADRSVRRGPQDHRLSRRAGGSQARHREEGHAEERAYSAPAALRRARRRSEAKPRWSIPFRRAISAATWTTGAIGKGATMYYPVAVQGALFSAGDPHASQGDSELCGTAIECSMTGTFQLIVRKKETLGGHGAGGPGFSAAGDARRMVPARLQLRQLPRGAGQGARARSTRSRRSTWLCETPSARCAAS